jgi:hypothetical protein
MAFKVRPKTLKHRKWLTVVIPNGPSKVIAIVDGSDGPELATTLRKDILIFATRFKFVSVLDFVSNVVNDFLHDIQFKPKDHNLRVPECVKQTRGKRPFRACLILALKNVCNVPSEFLDLSKKLLVSRVGVIGMISVSRHGRE